MDYTLNKFRIELNDLIQKYRERNIPPYIISGIIVQEQLRLKEFEIAEFTLAVENTLRAKENKDDGDATDIQQS